MLSRRLFISAAVFLLLNGCLAHQRTDALMGFEVPRGTFYAGDIVEFSYRLLADEFETTEDLWVGLSLRNPLNQWLDVPAEEWSVASRGGRVKLVWQVPDTAISGPYDVVMALWDGHPGPQAVRLDDIRVDSALLVYRQREHFDSLDDWNISTHRVGFSRFRVHNVSLGDETVRIRIPANSREGGEISHVVPVRYGSYRVRMQVPDAPSSITGFFLYAPPDFDQEIDIEVFNDTSGRIMFTTYAGGEQTNSETVDMDVDFTDDFHEFRMDYYPHIVQFFVNDMLVCTFDEGLPHSEMELMINTWFPRWLAGSGPIDHQYLVVDWVDF